MFTNCHRNDGSITCTSSVDQIALFEFDGSYKTPIILPVDNRGRPIDKMFAEYSNPDAWFINFGVGESVNAT